MVVEMKTSNQRNHCQRLKLHFNEGKLFKAAPRLLLRFALRLFAGTFLVAMSGVTASAAAPPKAEEERKSTELPEPFNPAKCKHGDKKYVYWAAGDQVFRFKFDPAVPLRSTAEFGLTGVRLNAKREVPPAPDPTETEGCYLNPMRADGVPYMDKFDAQLFQAIVGRKLQTNLSPIRGFFAVPKNWDVSLNVGQRQWERVQHTCWMRTEPVRNFVCEA
jgi:hypothetical protein